jgi:hypothetical protein
MKKPRARKQARPVPADQLAAIRGGIFPIPSTIVLDDLVISTSFVDDWRTSP